MKNNIIYKKDFLLVPVNNSKYSNISSAIEKANFIRQHEIGTYKLINGDYQAEEYLYMIIDISNDGYCLTPKKGLTFNECISLIKMYL